MISAWMFEILARHIRSNLLPSAAPIEPFARFQLGFLSSEDFHRSSSILICLMIFIDLHETTYRANRCLRITSKTQKRTVRSKTYIVSKKTRVGQRMPWDAKCHQGMRSPTHISLKNVSFVANRAFSGFFRLASQAASSQPAKQAGSQPAFFCLY